MFDVNFMMFHMISLKKTSMIVMIYQILNCQLPSTFVKKTANQLSSSKPSLLLRCLSCPSTPLGQASAEIGEPTSKRPRVGKVLGLVPVRHVGGLNKTTGCSLWMPMVIIGNQTVQNPPFRSIEFVEFNSH